MEVLVAPAPAGLQEEYKTLFTADCTRFIANLVRAFRIQVQQLYITRRQREVEIACKKWQPAWSDVLSPQRSNDHHWIVDPLPEALQNRQLDLGDVSPSNLTHLSQALRADVQGIQVDFDDGHCPTWAGELLGHFHVRSAVNNELPHVPSIDKAPVIMFRPRAWNMTEHNVLVDGAAVAGPLFDFGIHMFHNGRKLFEAGRGPFFYLSKLESAAEAALWDSIFTWTEERLNMPIGTIKACVLIEDVMAAFEMDAILFALRHHSAGLNCGIWDYCASIVARFGSDSGFLLPDRNKYVNMDQPFLRNYMELAVRLCQRRGTCTTGGMAAILADAPEAVTKTVNAKRKEIETGVSGFMVYDIRLVPAIKKLWAEFSTGPKTNTSCEPITVCNLLEVPAGGVTFEGLRHNLQVALLFIAHWMRGEGHFIHKGAVEDSATAEISRWQVHQWIVHQAKIESSNESVTLGLVLELASAAAREMSVTSCAVSILLRLLTINPVPQFITTFLSDFVMINSTWVDTFTTSSRL